MTSKTIFVALSASFLCGWLSVPFAVATEPEAAPAPAAAAPAASAATQAATPAASPTDSPATAVQNAAVAKTEATSAAASTAASAKPAAPTGDDEIVCKKQEVFGSRVRKTQICRTKREWQMESQAAKDYTKGINKGSAPGPGGQSLPTGG